MNSCLCYAGPVRDAHFQAANFTKGRAGSEQGLPQNTGAWSEETGPRTGLRYEQRKGKALTMTSHFRVQLFRLMPVAGHEQSLTLFVLPSMTAAQESRFILPLEGEKEAISLTGRIQPFGVLLTVDPKEFTIQNISENCLKLWDRHSFALLGRSFAEFISAETLDALRVCIAACDRGENSPLRLTLTFDEYARREWNMRVHRHHDVLFFECEPAVLAPSVPDTQERPVLEHQAVRELQSASSVQELCEKAVRLIREVTGFGRVMLYRFNQDWHGELIAEACTAGMDSYLGLHLPASTIPARERASFLQNGLRMIPDVDYTPARIYPNQHPRSGDPLDLERAMLRSVSPVHLENLRNMNVKSSLTISLINGQKVWGLIACHHPAPLLIDARTRLVLDTIGGLVSSQLAAG